MNILMLLAQEFTMWVSEDIGFQTALLIKGKKIGTANRKALRILT
jgi:hypothetical protein